ncbi:transcriptional regulator [Aneurinibacillus migulanus]|uniref:Pleiotropic regulatory protein n=1 Tax=Aneurinibacillus migulanus TaxID=47500 RepID=A0A0D1XZ75_ANEMI|nr:DegT/DnrJ/EryC1/StrS family aminotransferase [Aneurinibacillus migulanus]KIV52372.1 Pleiotropic regulatory protein [Aneurinibacillus migulanus]KON94543.1 Pleiotropic regulatory protein [Aneurinibacillus migulanus]KPD05598.1 transcriptional regulator [Aneurinibacillus migulanus]MCP1356994.1 DegT/DnrJ/EryC1/StrS family aminotransferase [Aneurinibacillus migulanus]MED0892576.1 DegT/DnrJ/EryC1/StrS family aminotransferase [Aneurinibacillus migulanus]
MEQTMRKVSLLDLTAQYEDIKPEIKQAVDNVLESGNYIMGPFVKSFEQAMAEYCGTKYAIGVANGTDALLLTLDALGVGAGDEVITTPFTFFASAEVISQLGATPVFVDIDPDTYNMDPAKLEAAITPKTKAIMPVHIFGQPVDMDEILEIANKHNVFVVEDACQAIGSRYKGKRIGSLGTAGCFSFFPTKNLGGYGDGGIVVTNDEELARKIQILRVHGSNPKYYHSVIGYNSRLDALQAAMLQVKLKYIDQWNQQRRDKAAIYNEALKDLSITLPYVKENREAVFHLYIIQTKYRDELMAHLKEHGIASGVYYPVPLHKQEVYSDLEYEDGSLAESEKASLGTMALPLYPELTMDDQEYVISVVREFFEAKGERV